MICAFFLFGDLVLFVHFSVSSSFVDRTIREARLEALVCSTSDSKHRIQWTCGHAGQYIPPNNVPQGRGAQLRQICYHNTRNVNTNEVENCLFSQITRQIIQYTSPIVHEETQNIIFVHTRTNCNNKEP